LLTIVAIALCAAISNADDWPQVVVFAQTHRDWLASFLNLENGIPCRKTFERVFAALSPHGLNSCLLRWLDQCGRLANLGHIAIDGKTLRSSGSEAQGLGMLHLVSAWSTEANLCLGQVACSEKSNEITAIPQLLNLLQLKGAVKKLLEQLIGLSMQSS
jgi:hypothetical protein